MHIGGMANRVHNHDAIFHSDQMVTAVTRI